MSRTWLLAPAVLLSTHAGGALAQEPLSATDAAAQGLIDEARSQYSIIPERRRPRPCPESSPDEIVVCKRTQEDDSMRVPSEVDPDGGAAPRAPDFDGGPNPNATARGCFIPPCPPPEAILIDLDALPEAVDFPVGRAD